MEAMALPNERDRVASPALTAWAVAGGLVLVGQAVAAAVTKQNSAYSGTTGDFVSDAALAAGLLVSLVALDQLRRILAPRIGALAVAGQAAIVVAIVATVVAGREVLDIVYIVGTVAWFAGLVGIAVAAWRAVDRRWLPAVALPLTALVALALADAGGAVLLGLVWLVLGMRARRS